jgi:hypothetical protein
MDELCWYGYVDCEEGGDDIPYEVFEEIFNSLNYDLPEDIYWLLVDFDPMNMDDPANQDIAGQLMNFYGVDEM